MSTYLIGDIHGCYVSLKKILNKVSFNPRKDVLWMTGDLVAKGPSSLKVLDLVYNIRRSVKIVLGNHDLNLLKLYSILNNETQKKYLNNNISILQSSYFSKLITWLRYQPMMQIDEEKKIIMTHAGINPTWNIHTMKKYAQEIEEILKSKNYRKLLSNIYSTQQHNTNFDTLNDMHYKKFIRIQLNVNMFTRMRYILPNGELDLNYKGTPQQAPLLLQPWFNMPGLISPKYNIIFGHWSALQGEGIPSGIYGLDSGCYQGKKLTLLQWENKKFTYVSCNLNNL